MRAGPGNPSAWLVGPHTLEQTAALLGVGRATVPRLQQSLRGEGTETSRLRPAIGADVGCGMMTPEEETAFSQPMGGTAPRSGGCWSLPDSRSAGTALGPSRSPGGVPVAGAPWLA